MAPFRGGLFQPEWRCGAPPGAVGCWYRDAGYDFLTVTEHDMVTLPDDEPMLAARLDLGQPQLLRRAVPTHGRAYPAAMGDEHTDRGVLAGGLPFNRTGRGPPAVVLQGLTFENRAQSGLEARFTLSLYRRLGEYRTVWVVNRRPGLARGTTLSEVAGDYAHMIRTEFEPPIDIIGLSSGGSIALHLAAEHPGLVKRLVLQDCACRTTDWAREWSREVARRAGTGDWRGVSRSFMGAVQPDNVVGRTMAWLFAPLMAMNAPDDPADMITLIEAESELDFRDRLAEITAPTLVACGENDPFSGAELARETAAGVADGRAIVYAGQRHGVRGKEYERDLVTFLVDGE